MYTVLSTLVGSSEHPSSITPTAVGRGTAPLVVALAITDAFSAARLLAAVLARWASMPVAAARPITAAESSAMMHDRTKTRKLQPHIVLEVIGLLSGAAAAGWTSELKGEAAVWPLYADGGACEARNASCLGGGVGVPYGW